MNSLRDHKILRTGPYRFCCGERNFHDRWRSGRQAGPGFFMRMLSVTFPSIIVATTAAITERILQNAVDIKSENDLTV